MAKGNQTAARVDRNAARERGVAVARQICTLAFLGKAQRLGHLDLGHREAVVHLGNLDVPRLDVGRGICARSGLGRVLHACQIALGIQIVRGKTGRQHLHKLLARNAEPLCAGFAHKHHGCATVRHLRAVGDLEVGLELRVRQEGRVCIAGLGGLFERHLDGIHVRERVLVAVAVGLDGHVREILGREAVLCAIGLDAHRKQRRECKVVNLALDTVVRRTRKEITALARRNSRLHLDTGNESDIETGLDRSDSRVVCKTTRCTCAFNSHRRNEAECRLNTNERGTKMALLAEQLARKVANPRRLNVLGGNPRVLQRSLHRALHVLLECGILLLSKHGVLWVDKVLVALAEKRCDFSAGKKHPSCKSTLHHFR
eukprot:comp20712_c0_seq1/m.42505 comp20712_c0_seq1/g.42505  ORF comp20712_c0_seq1/g.42505 comp20712_c0_seq1/m.42505 type:complete len:372 (+) comp20712_c0_seq1:199-1314(+)